MLLANLLNEIAKIIQNKNSATQEKKDQINHFFDREVYGKNSSISLDNRKYYVSIESIFYSEALIKKLEKTHGLAINEALSDGSTLLCIASSEEDLALIKWMVEELNANIHITNAAGETPAFIALRCGKKDNFHYFLTKDADINAATTEEINDSQLGIVAAGATALHLAVRLGDIATVKYLLKQHGVRLQKNQDGLNPAELAEKLYEVSDAINHEAKHEDADRYFINQSHMLSVDILSEILILFKKHAEPQPNPAKLFHSRIPMYAIAPLMGMYSPLTRSPAKRGTSN